MNFFKALPVGLAIAVVSTAACAVDITGAGSTFAAPIYAKWAAAYQQINGVRVNYQGIGSSGGVKQLLAKTIDFAGSDAPMKDDELARKGLFQFPTVIGGVVPVVNLRGIAAGQLVLSGQVLGDIYLGKITKWNDPAIVALNPKVTLPNRNIAVVRRADGSGTSFIWTNYLAKVNPEWKTKVGAGATVNWPVGIGGQGNDGVAAFVQRIPGAIGYVEYAYVKQNKMTYVDLMNAAGKPVAPNADSFKAAAAGADWSKTFYQILTNEPGVNAWPVVGATFVLMYKTQGKPAQGAAILKFFDWAFKYGSPQAAALDYVSLPDLVEPQIRAKWLTNIKDATGKAVAF